MATNTYVALDTKTLTSNAASVIFTSINQGYTDLVLVCNSGQVTADTSYNLRVGASNTIDTGSNYSDTALNSNGSTASSYRNSSSSRILPAGSNSSSISDNLIFHIQNYSNTTTYKTVLSRANVPGFRVVATVSLWRNTAAINTLEIYGGSNLLSDSTFTLYGIANSNIGAPKAFGGTITQDATYTYHTFGASGTFTPQQTLVCDYLVVGGGGGGGGTLNPSPSFPGGGGGAGGLQSATGQTVSAGSYTVTIGAGSAMQGTGTDTSLGSLLTSAGGGRGVEGNYVSNGGSGGSGGGGGGNRSAGSTGGTASSGQGSNGGDGVYNASGNYAGGGGGGKTSAGATAVAASAGNGGGGTADFTTWGAVTGTGQNVGGTYYYAGGGGGAAQKTASTAITGGSGGNGGGGAGAITGGATGGSGSTTGAAGIINTGGGGGGNANSTTGSGSGGSGIVIIRYAN